MDELVQAQFSEDGVLNQEVVEVVRSRQIGDRVGDNLVT
jgi:hypothetical protein